LDSSCSPFPTIIIDDTRFVYGFHPARESSQKSQGFKESGTIFDRFSANEYEKIFPVDLREWIEAAEILQDLSL
jgi:hypothetical protein